MKFIFVFCEGFYDVVFFYKILKLEGYVSYNKKLGEYLVLINNFLVNEVMYSLFEEVNFQLVIQWFFFVEVMRKVDFECLIFLYVLGGDSRSVECLRIFCFLQDSFVIFDFDVFFLGEEYNVAVIYFFDVDEVGI